MSASSPTTSGPQGLLTSMQGLVAAAQAAERELQAANARVESQALEIQQLKSETGQLQQMLADAEAENTILRSRFDNYRLAIDGSIATGLDASRNLVRSQESAEDQLRRADVSIKRDSAGSPPAAPDSTVNTAQRSKNRFDYHAPVDSESHTHRHLAMSGSGIIETEASYYYPSSQPPPSPIPPLNTSPSPPTINSASIPAASSKAANHDPTSRVFRQIRHSSHGRVTKSTPRRQHDLVSLARYKLAPAAPLVRKDRRVLANAVRGKGREGGDGGVAVKDTQRVIVREFEEVERMIKSKYDPNLE